MEEVVDIRRLAYILKQKIWLILLFGVIFSSVAGAVTLFLIPASYKASAQLIVQSNSAESTTSNLQNDINGNVLLINTYKDMILGDLVLEDVSSVLQNDYQYSLNTENLLSKLSVEQSQNSQMFKIVAEAGSPIEATRIANTTAEIFQSTAQDVLDVNKVTITSNAKVPKEPDSPNLKLNILIGLLVGVFGGIGLILLFECFDKTIKDEEFVNQELGLPLLGQVYQLNKKDLSENGYFDTREVNKAKNNQQRPRTIKKNENVKVAK